MNLARETEVERNIANYFRNYYTPQELSDTEKRLQTTIIGNSARLDVASQSGALHAITNKVAEDPVAGRALKDWTQAHKALFEDYMTKVTDNSLDVSGFQSLASYYFLL